MLTCVRRCSDTPQESCSSLYTVQILKALINNSLCVHTACCTLWRVISMFKETSIECYNRSTERIRLLYQHALWLHLMYNSFSFFLIKSSHFFFFFMQVPTPPHSVKPTLTKTENRANYYKVKTVTNRHLFLSLYWQDPIFGFRILRFNQMHQQARAQFEYSWLYILLFLCIKKPNSLKYMSSIWSGSALSSGIWLFIVRPPKRRTSDGY